MTTATDTSRQQEKRARFARMFPARVDTLRDTLRKISNCSNRGNYDWDPEKVQKAWELIAEEFADTAASTSEINSSQNPPSTNDHIN